jgi:hypothetical protein
MKLLDRYCLYAKIYGERNTGTNYVEQLLHANFVVHCLQSNNRVYDYVRAVGVELPKKERGKFRSKVVDIDCERVVSSEFGWKHGIPPVAEIRKAPHQKHTLFICIAKHPVAWLKSLLERPYNPVERPPETFAEFIRYAWPVTARDNMLSADRVNVIDLWNCKNRAYQDLPNETEKCLITAYEDILAEPARFMDRVAEHLFRRNKSFVWELPSSKGETMTFEDYRTKYDVKTLCSTISIEDVEYIKANADPKVMAAHGYYWPSLPV